MLPWTSDLEASDSPLPDRGPRRVLLPPPLQPDDMFVLGFMFSSGLACWPKYMLGLPNLQYEAILQQEPSDRYSIGSSPAASA